MELTPMPRRVRLPDGRELTIRHVEARDVEGLAALYSGLDDEARYRRFFSIYRPKRSFFVRMASVSERGGAGLLATVVEEGARERVVAEASYERLSNGNGELSITVDRAWRGWLGPFLLDALVEVAASRGVPNLEADVLATNRPMLALLQSRGYAVAPHHDWTVVRGVIGTEHRTPTWPSARRGLRVVVEGVGGHWHAADAAAAAGLEVLACPGPERQGGRCPVLLGAPCPLVASADAVVISNPLDTGRWSTLRAAHPHLHPGVPVCVELSSQSSGPAIGETVLARPEANTVETVQHLAQVHVSGEPSDQGRAGP